MATLRYIAYLANEPEKLVGFYGRFLGTEELGRSAEGDISITDGYYNLTFFQKRLSFGEMHMELVITGKRPLPKCCEDGELKIWEIPLGRFERRIRLGRTEKAVAVGKTTLQDGLLIIEIRNQSCLDAN